MSLLEQKQNALRYKFESIATELAAWQALTAKNQPLEKHYTQVRLISTALAGMIEVVGAKVNQVASLPDAVDFYQQAPRAERWVLEVHRTWNYYRSRFAPRSGAPLDLYLEALDELAWKFYELPMKIARQSGYLKPEQLLEPPLVYFNSDWSPAAYYRDSAISLETTATEGSAGFAQAGSLNPARLLRNQIPMIAVPWFDLSFLPETLIMAHEVAHLLDDDLRLAQPMTEWLNKSKIPVKRLKAGWLPWRAEIFADLYGVLCLGNAYVGMLLTLLARTPQEVRDLPDPQNAYPVHYLRAKLALRALDKLGFASQAKVLEQLWQEAYPGDDFIQRAYLPDFDRVIQAILFEPYAALGNKSFEQLPALRWNNYREQSARQVSTALLNNTRPLPTGDPALLIAGVQYAFATKPGGLLTQGAAGIPIQAEVLHHIIASRETGVRASSDPARLTPAVLQAATARGRLFGEQILGDQSLLV